MILDPKPMAAAEAALRLMARRGRGDWMVFVVAPSDDARGAAEELAQEMESVGDQPVQRVRGAQDTPDLVSRLAPTQGPVVVSALDDWPPSEWARLDRVRSRLAREERTAIVVSAATFERIMQEAPNFSSWLGASVAMYRPHAAELSEEERGRRLSALRTWSGLSDEEVLARAERGTLPAEPEFAEWLVLLDHGDLLER
jgi:hypothetical protein